MKAINYTPEIDQAICIAYQSSSYGDGSISAAIKKTGLSAGALHRRAMKLGVATVKANRIRWDKAQLKLLEDNAHLPIKQLQAKFLKVCRVSRTESSIISMMREKGITITQSRLDAGIYPAAELARLMGVNPNTPIYWIKIGILKATKRPGIKITEYEITEEAIKDMLINCTAAINFARIDKYWLVDVLTGEIGAKSK